MFVLFFVCSLLLPANPRGAQDAKRVARAVGQQKRRAEREEQAALHKAKMAKYYQQRKNER
jgi:hypothetical protein